MIKRMTSREDILKIIRDFPDGIGLPFIRETLGISDSTVRYWAGRLIEEGFVRKEEKFVFERPYYWFITYYPVEVVLPPPILEYIHKTLVYNVKYEEEGRKLDVSITFDFDCKNDESMKDILMRACMLKGHSWLGNKFGDRLKEPEKWAETKETASDPEVIARLREAGEEFTMLYFKWNYWRQFGAKTEAGEGDMGWTEDVPVDISWYTARKGRKKI